MEKISCKVTGPVQEAMGPQTTAPHMVHRSLAEGTVPVTSARSIQLKINGYAQVLNMSLRGTHAAAHDSGCTLQFAGRASDSIDNALAHVTSIRFDVLSLYTPGLGDCQ
jgi:hypothetical protein